MADKTTAIGAAGGATQDAILGEKPTTRGKTPFKPKASNSLSFALSKKLQKAFTPLAVEVDKVKYINSAQLTAFFDKAGIKYHPSDIDIVMQQLKFDYDRGMRGDAHQLSFDDVLEMLNWPNMTFCLHLEDLVSKERRDMIKSYMKIIVGTY